MNYDRSKLKGKIAERDLNGRKLAKLMGVSETVISRWLAGEPIPQIRQLQMQRLLNIRNEEHFDYFMSQKQIGRPVGRR